MNNLASLQPATLAPGTIGVAEITDVSGQSFTVQLLGDQRLLQATRARCCREPLSTGDQVLYAVVANGTLHLTGLIAKGAHDTDDAAHVCYVAEPDLSETLQVRSETNALLFEYNPTSKRSRVYLEGQGLDVLSPKGDIRFHAAGAVSLSGKTISMVGSESIRAQLREKRGQWSSAFELGRDAFKLATAKLQINTDLATAHITESKLEGERLDTKIKQQRNESERLEQRTGTLVSVARNSIETVEELAQQTLGRLTSKIFGTYRMKAEKAKMRTEGHFNIDGEQINIG